VLVVRRPGSLTGCTRMRMPEAEAAPGNTNGSNSTSLASLLRDRRARRNRRYSRTGGHEFHCAARSSTHPSAGGTHNEPPRHDLGDWGNARGAGCSHNSRMGERLNCRGTEGPKSSRLIKPKEWRSTKSAWRSPPGNSGPALDPYPYRCRGSAEGSAKDFGWGGHIRATKSGDRHRKLAASRRENMAGQRRQQGGLGWTWN